MYAQDNNSLPVWSIFCHQLTNSYLHQFSTIFGGNCITQYLTLVKNDGVHSPSASQASQTNLSRSLVSQYPPDPGEHVLKRSVTSTSEQDIPVQWFKFIHPSPKPRKDTETPFSLPSSSSETNRVSNCHSSLVTTPSSRLIFGKPKIKVTKVLTHNNGKNEEYFHGENWHNTTKNRENSD